jgi:hypothetical protein
MQDTRAPKAAQGNGYLPTPKAPLSADELRFMAAQIDIVIFGDYGNARMAASRIKKLALKRSATGKEITGIRDATCPAGRAFVCWQKAIAFGKPLNFEDCKPINALMANPVAHPDFVQELERIEASLNELEANAKPLNNT